MQSLRVGVNYQLGADPLKNEAFTKGVPPLDAGDFAVHGQATLVEQYAAPFHAPYAGQNSLASNSGRETFDLDLYVGYRPWKGAEIWVDPEIDQGFGLSGTFGVAGFPSAEAYKVGQTYPYARIPRAFLRQTIDLGGETQKVDAGINQFAGTPDRRPAGHHRRQVQRGRYFRQEQIRQRPAQRLPELDAGQHRRVRLCGRCLGLHLWRRRRVVHRAMDVSRRRVRWAGRSEQHRPRSDASASSRWSAKSSAATICSVSPARCWSRAI